MGNAGAEAAAAAVGGKEEYGEEASGVTLATGRIPIPSNWGSMIKTQRRNLVKKAKGKLR